MSARLGLRLGQMALVGVSCMALVVACGGGDNGGSSSGGSGGTEAGAGAGGTGTGGTGTGGTGTGGTGTGGSGGMATGGTGGMATGGTGGMATGGTGGAATGGTGGASTGGTGGAGTGGTGGSGACDLSGTWGTYIDSPVTWKGTGALSAGSGHLREWLLSTRTQNGNKTVDKAVPCRIVLPDFQSTPLLGEKYGTRFPNASFDKGKVPATTLNGTLSGTTTGSTFSTPNTALLLGLSMANAATATWPATSSGITSRDDDADNHPGFTVNAATGAGYSNFPVALQLPPLPRADRLYLATRTVASLSGKLTSCTQIDGSVKFAVLGGTPAINSHVLGCRRVGGANCTTQERDFVDNNQPAFAPAAGSVMKSVKLANNATCSDVRSALP